MSLTQKQYDVLQFIKSFISDNGIPPTRAEIADNFGWWPNAAQVHVKGLERKGAITIKLGAQRGIVPVKGFRAKVKPNHYR